MNRSSRTSPHRCQRMPEPVIEIGGVDRSHRQARQRFHDCGVIEGCLACVLKFSEPLHHNRHFAAQHENRRGIGLGRGDRRRHVAEARPANSERRAEMPARARIAVRHIRGAPLMCGDHRLKLGMPRQGREKGIDQSAGNEEQMTDFKIKSVPSAMGYSSCSPLRWTILPEFPGVSERPSNFTAGAERGPLFELSCKNLTVRNVPTAPRS